MFIAVSRMQHPPAVFDVRRGREDADLQSIPTARSQWNTAKQRPLAALIEESSQRLLYNPSDALSIPIPGPIVVDNVTFFM